MRKVTPITEQLQHFVEELQEGFWGALCGRTRLAGQELGSGCDRRLPGLGRRDRDRLSAGVASTLLGAQDAQHSREGSPTGLRGSPTRRPGDLPGRQSGSGTAGVLPLSSPLARRLSDDGAAVGVSTYPGWYLDNAQIGRVTRGRVHYARPAEAI